MEVQGQAEPNQSWTVTGMLEMTEYLRSRLWIMIFYVKSWTLTINDLVDWGYMLTGQWIGIHPSFIRLLGSICLEAPFQSALRLVASNVFVTNVYFDLTQVNNNRIFCAVLKLCQNIPKDTE